MKKNDLIEIKNINTGELVKKLLAAKKEFAGLVLDKNMGKLKDLKAVFKKRRDIAQMSTIVKQKQLLDLLEEKETK